MLENGTYAIIAEIAAAEKINESYAYEAAITVAYSSSNLVRSSNTSLSDLTLPASEHIERLENRIARGSC